MIDHSPISDRAFGMTLAAAAVVFGAGPILFERPARPLLLAVAILLALAAQGAPFVLHGGKNIWLAVTGRIGWALNQAILGLLFFTVITPVATLLRLCGRDVLGRRFSARESYWETRPSDPRPAKKSFQQQF